MKILVAEDEPEIMRIYRLLLEEKGYQVISTEDGKQCLHAYKTALNKTMYGNIPFNLVILDYRMPEKNGIEVAKEILALCPAQELLMVTAYRGQLELQDEVLQKMQIIEKPFDVDELVSAITHLVSH